MIDDAMREIEAENPTLKGALPKVFGRESIDRAMLTGLIDLFTNIHLHGTRADFDLIGRIYEYCIGEFASSEGKRGGEFYTPKSVVDTMVEMIEPTRGRVYDPCCGTGGFFVQSERFIGHHQGRRRHRDLRARAEPHHLRLARMNLAIRGIFADIRWNSGRHADARRFPDERFDSSSPTRPSTSRTGTGDLCVRTALALGAPPVGNANFAWISTSIHTLRLGDWRGGDGQRLDVLDASGEGDIRRAMVEEDAVDAMVALPGQLFFGTQIPACLWILARDKSNGIAKNARLRDRRGEVLFIDARKMGALVSGSRKQKELSQSEVQKIARAYHAWRGEAGRGRLCRRAGLLQGGDSLEEIAKHNFVLTPGRYVGAGAVEDDDELFEEKFDRLLTTLRAQFAEGRRLEAEIEARLGTVG